MGPLLILLPILLPITNATVGKPGWVRWDAVQTVLRQPEAAQCSLVQLMHGPVSAQSVREMVGQFGIPNGVFEAQLAREAVNDSWTRQLSLAVRQARKIRLLSWCVTVVVVSDDLDFLAVFAESSLQHRLLVWATRLLVLTRLPLQQLHRLVSSHWTFSMMNTMVLNQQQDSSGNSDSFSVYSHLPYSPRGPQMVRVATWRHNGYVKSSSHFKIFPEKFSNFHGATINVAALPYAPYWDETVLEAEDGRPVKIYSGTDYQLLSVMCHYLNFKIYNIPTHTWKEIGQLVAERKAFMSPVHHVPVAQRRAMYDFSYGYEFGSIDFCAAVPSLRPKWHSLYYPLSDHVWLAVLAMLIIVPVSLYLMNLLATWVISENRMSLGVSSQTVIATLLAQDLPVKPPKTQAIRALVTAWLLYALIIGAMYRGNLTAALTLPKYPPRPETIADLVKAFDKISMPLFGQVFIDNYKKSSTPVIREMGKTMYLAPSVLEALRRTRDGREAHVGWRSYIATIIASHFILADGSTEIYLGRESVSHTLTAWPLPHDAPFTRQVDAIMVAVLEAGLYERWREEFLDVIKKKTRMKLQQANQEKERGSSGNAGGMVSALSLVHMQGPLLMVLLGLISATLVFTVELSVSCIYCPFSGHQAAMMEPSKA